MLEVEYGFVLREEKCNILQSQVKFLAHIAKVDAIVMPPPKDVTKPVQASSSKKHLELDRRF